MTQHNQTTSKDLPASIAYHVPGRDTADWVRIGAVWLHKDGKGFSLDLELIPETDRPIACKTACKTFQIPGVNSVQ